MVNEFHISLHREIYVYSWTKLNKPNLNLISNRLEQAFSVFDSDHLTLKNLNIYESGLRRRMALHCSLTTMTKGIFFPFGERIFAVVYYREHSRILAFN